jgi:hypothetical protein
LVATETVLAGAASAVVLLGHAGPVPATSGLFWACLSLVVAWPALLAVTGAYEERSSASAAMSSTASPGPGCCCSPGWAS